MQLFHIPFTKNSDDTQLTIADQDTIKQCKKVCRMKNWDTLFVQDQLHIRHKITITQITDTEIQGEITESLEAPAQKYTTNILIAMPNKREKAEIIVQKLSEIGINTICFRPSERSIIKQRNTKKEQRLLSIAKEATEQSRNRGIPTIAFSQTPEGIITKQDQILFFDIPHKKDTETHISPVTNTRGIVGPEGGLTERDYARFTTHPHKKTESLGDSVLRMETAAIIGAWKIKNGK